ncbi:hypothetical protein [Dactylosporangium sp. NPDC000521]|uniref:hypothetical protein n=1 Tax=Dactylosporangium sp. NPDC000521 TaxID=3363975 RepID=UPI003690F8DB
MATRVGSGLAQLQFGWARLVSRTRTIRPGLFGYDLLLEERRHALLPEPSAPPGTGHATA